MARYVGIDAHSKNCVYAIQDEQGKIRGEGSVPTTLEGLRLLQARYDLAARTGVALESGTMAFFVARHLTKMGLDPVVVDAREVRQKALRPNQKSDRRDALELCEGLRRGIYRTSVHVPPENIQQLRETLGRRRHFVQLKTMEVNTVKHLLRAASLPRPRTLSTDVAWAKLLASLESDPALHGFVTAHRALWRVAHEQVQAMENALDALQAPLQADLDRVQTVPGVGRIVGLTVLAAFSDVKRFPSAKHAASYAGLIASSFDSGERVQHGHITRRGSSELRAMLCEAAHHAGYRSNPLSPFFRRICVRRGYKMAIVAVAHRLCRILFAMLRRGADFDPTRLEPRNA